MAEAAQSGAAPAQQPDILETIVAQRRLDVAAARASTPEDALRARIVSHFPQAPLNLCDRLRAAAPSLAVAAEFKRASPSKGAMVPLDTPVGPHAAAYTAGGAAILSVLTEPTWFKGSLADMEAARRTAEATAAAGGTPRPLILRKDFIVDGYQVLEARAHGADTLLLIVSSLPTVGELAPLIAACRALGMEPLVEVNSVPEVVVALAAGSRAIGINNRNLRTFKVDMGATVDVVAYAATHCGADASPPALLSLSGIRSAEDIAALTADCVSAAARAGGAPPSATLELMRGFLVGEAIMRAPEPRAMVAALVGAAAHAATLSAGQGGGAAAATAASSARSRVQAPVAGKICGVRTVDGALSACRHGADAVGVICVGGSPRYADPATAAAIVAAVRKFREQDPSELLARLAAEQQQQQQLQQASGGNIAALAALAGRQAQLAAAMRRARPLTVGVFMDQPLADVASSAAAAGLDVVQLHGTEDPADVAAARLPHPVVKVLHVPVPPAGAPAQTDAQLRAVAEEVAARVLAWAPHVSSLLLDSKVAGGGAAGGTGASFDAAAFLPALEAALADAVGSAGAPPPASPIRLPLMLAGGLTPASVGPALAAVTAAAAPPASAAVTAAVWAVDVSSGVEPDGPGGKGVKDDAKVAAFLAAAKRQQA